MCGSDGKTYGNICQMDEESCNQQKEILQIDLDNCNGNYPTHSYHSAPGLTFGFHLIPYIISCPELLQHIHKEKS